MNIKRYLLGGLLTVIPLWVTWLLFDFIFRQMSRFGVPFVRRLSAGLREDAPGVADVLVHDRFQEILAVVAVLLALYLLGWVASLVVGRQLLSLIESAVQRIPLVQTVYGSAKQLIDMLQTKPDSVQRVVLVEFPHAGMKAVGLVTRTFVDARSGDELAAVYVPTTPNPTSGFIIMVPKKNTIELDMEVDEAVKLIMSLGVVVPRWNKEQTRELPLKMPAD